MTLQKGNRAFERYRSEHGAAAYKGKYQRSWTRRLDNYREHRIVSYLLSQTSPGSTLLNVACGAGRFGEIMLQKAKKAVFSDFSLPMLQLSRKTLGGSTNAVSFIAADAAGLPFANDSFDVVTAIRLLHHFHDAGRCRTCLEEILRVSRRFAILTFADGGSFKSRWRRFRQRWFGRKRSEAVMERKQLSALAASAGYQTISFLPVSKLFSTQTYVLLKRNHG